MTKVIVSAAGHGGIHSGAVHSPFIEKELNLSVDSALAAALARKYTGFRHVRARTSDTTLTLADRVGLAKRENADCFLEIHFNSGGGTGPETYIARNYTSQDMALARAVHGNLYGYLGPTFNVRDRGIKMMDFYVLRETPGIPSILVEVLFLDHATDRAAIQTPGFIDNVGEVLADGVAEFLRLQTKEQAPPAEGTEELKAEIARLNEALQQCNREREALAVQVNDYRNRLNQIAQLASIN